MEPYFIYCRRSKNDPDDQKNSLDGQEKKGRKYAKDHKIPITTDTLEGLMTNGVIRESHSGWKTSPLSYKEDGTVEYKIERAKLMKAIGLLLEGRYGGMIIANWDRGSRNDLDDTVIKDLIDAQGIDVRFVEAEYDHKRSGGKLHRNVDGMVSQYWSDKTSDAIWDWHRSLRKKGLRGNQSPIGYLDTGDAGEKILDPERTPIIRDLFEKYSTGKWSIRSLVKEANSQGLTNKPRRRPRTQEEMDRGMEREDIEKAETPVGKGTIEGMLQNAYYIGKIKNLETGEWKSGSHPALLVDENGKADEILFYKIQGILRDKGHAYHSEDFEFYPYRKIIKCTCGRSYSPYRQKGIVYYQLKCKEGCKNTVRNLSEEDDILIEVQKLIEKIHFTDEEIVEIESCLSDGLKEVTKKQEKEEAASERKWKELVGKRRYLRDNRAELLSQDYTPVDWKKDVDALTAKIDELEAKRNALAVSDREMLEYVLTFSELIRDIGLHYKKANPEEIQKITTIIFSELQFFDGKIKNYEANPEFALLLSRGVMDGGRWRT